MQKLERIYHPYWKWEEINFNMWGEIKGKEKWIEDAIKFTSDHKKYGRYMRKVTLDWVYSCENALTDYFINRKAWLGHAACALAFRCPENIVRQAWRHLTYEQQLLANNEASRAIQLWEDSHIKSKSLYQDMGGQMLFQWDTR